MSADGPPRLIDVEDLRYVLRDFAAERDWEQFHTPKNLATALTVEASELLELFQWLTADQSAEICEDTTQCARVAAELADVLIYLVRLSDILGIDLDHAVAAKLATNAEKYPADRVKGSAAKYTEYQK